MLRFLLLVCLSLPVLAQERIFSVTLAVDADPQAGFGWPYYLYLPPACLQSGETVFPLLVAPNNSGKIDDDPEVHRAAAAKEMGGLRRLADRINTPVLVPAFPRPADRWQLYTHALDRDSLLLGEGALARLDLQLMAMIEHARVRLTARGVKIRPKIWMDGFSASGMFVNRFALLHPELVERAAIGSPGGWPLAPVAQSGGKDLPYPVGSADLITLTGQPLQLEAVRQIEFFFYLGDKDSNDSVAYDDGYDPADRALVHLLFGKTPVERWPVAQSLYRQAGLKAKFKLYPGAGHETTAEMQKDLLQFFQLTP